MWIDNSSEIAYRFLSKKSLNQIKINSILNYVLEAVEKVKLAIDIQKMVKKFILINLIIVLYDISSKR